jgi:hypothetical protein
MRNMTNPRKASMDVMRVVGRTPASLAGARAGTVDVATVVKTDAFYCASPVSAAARRRRPHEKGVPGKVVAQLMRHAKVDTTPNVYTQVIDGALRAAVDKVGSELFAMVHKPETGVELTY